MTDKYVNWGDVWSILKKVEYEKYNEDIGMNDIIDLMRQSHGSYEVKENELLFIEKYNYMDYKWSSSLIGAEDAELLIEQNKKHLQKIEEERDCIGWLLDRLNEGFDKHDEDYLKVFFERNILNNNVETILDKHKISRKRFYTIMKNAEYLTKRAWLLSKPSKEILKLLGCEHIYD